MDTKCNGHFREVRGKSLVGLSPAVQQLTKRRAGKTWSIDDAAPPTSPSNGGGRAMSSQNLPSMQDNARELRTSGMDANQMYEDLRAIAGASEATPLARGLHRSSHDAGEVLRLPPPHRASPPRPPRRPPHQATAPCHHAARRTPPSCHNATLGAPARQGELSPIPSHLLPAGAGIQRRDSDNAAMQAPYVSSQAHLLQPSDYNPMPTAVPPPISKPNPNPNRNPSPSPNPTLTLTLALALTLTLTLARTRCLRPSRPTPGRWACGTCCSSSL